MILSRSQKKYLKKNLKNLTLAQIATNLKISEKEIHEYLKSQWRKEKYETFLNERKQNNAQCPKPEPLNLNLKSLLTNHWIIISLLIFLVFTVYFNSLRNDFLSDDIATIKESALIKQTNYFWNPPDTPNLRSFVVFLTHKIFGLNPLFFRLSNIFFHLGSVLVIYLLISFFLKPPGPLIAACLFAVHPLLTESVTWISGGPYSNGAFFALLSFLFYLYARKSAKIRTYILSYVFFLIAILFSEKLVGFPIVLFLYELCFGNLKVIWNKLAPFFAISSAYGLKLIGSIGTRTAHLETTYYQSSGFHNPFTQIPIAISSYLELIFWPNNLTFYHSEMTFTQTEFFLRTLILLLFLGVTILAFFRNRPVFFWLTFFLIPLLPTLTPLKISWIVAERYVYLGTLGIFVIIAMGFNKLLENIKFKFFAVALFSFILTMLSVRTVVRNFDWKDQDALWLATDKVSPTSPQNHNNLGDLYSRHGNFEKSAEEFKKAITLKPDYGDAYHNLANTYQQMGKSEEAIQNYQRALSLNPRLWQSHQNLGAIYFEKGKDDLAIDNFEKAISISPQNATLHASLGIINLKVGNKAKAKEELSKSLELNPNDQRVKQFLDKANQ